METTVNNFGWISVEERFPGKGERVIAFADYGGYFIAYRNVNDQWRISPEWRLNIPDGALINITHWQPLPPPPNEKSASLKPNKLSDSIDKFKWSELEKIATPEKWMEMYEEFKKVK